LVAGTEDSAEGYTRTPRKTIYCVIIRCWPGGLPGTTRRSHAGGEPSGGWVPCCMEGFNAGYAKKNSFCSGCTIFMHFCCYTSSLVQRDRGPRRVQPSGNQFNKARPRADKKRSDRPLGELSRSFGSK